MSSNRTPGVNSIAQDDLHCFHCTVISFPLIFRLKLAALHFNENANGPQAVTKEGDECYNIVFPKYKKGGYIVKKVLVKPTYSKEYACVYAVAHANTI